MDTELERRLRDALDGGARMPCVDEPNPAQFRARVDSAHDQRGHRRPRHVSFQRWMAPALSAVLVVGSWLCISLVGTEGPHSSGRHGGGAAAPPVGGSPLAAKTASSLPRDLSLTDFTFVNDFDGWVIGQRPCGSAPCAVVEHTVDKGKSWEQVPAPDLSAGCFAGSCPAPGIRFADDRVGYAFTDQSFYQTTDGGSTWQQQAGGAVNLEVRNGVALRLSDVQPCNFPCGRTLSSARVGSSAWSPVPLSGDPSTGGWWGSLLVRTGHEVVLALLRNEASGGNQSVQATVYVSGDDGEHWSNHPDPCGPVGSVEADTRALAAAADGSIGVLCMPRTDDGAYILQSFDGGMSFGGRRLPTVTGGEVVALATPDRTTFLVSLLHQGKDTLYRSNGGGSWQVVAEAGSSNPANGSETLGFEDARNGRWMPLRRSGLYSSTDGGKSWTPGAGR